MINWYCMNFCRWQWSLYYYRLLVFLVLASSSSSYTCMFWNIFAAEFCYTRCVPVALSLAAKSYLEVILWIFASSWLAFSPSTCSPSKHTVRAIVAISKCVIFVMDGFVGPIPLYLHYTGASSMQWPSLPGKIEKTAGYRACHSIQYMLQCCTRLRCFESALNRCWNSVCTAWFMRTLYWCICAATYVWSSHAS